MKSRLSVQINAPLDRIFDLASDVERWPQRLPHYRYVRRLQGAGGERCFAMGARRGPLPVRWQAIERPLPDERRIEFLHTGGVTRGMTATWRFDERDGGFEVSIDHELVLGWPIIGRFAADRVIGPVFIEPIAARTLRRVKALAEGTA